MQEVVTWTRSLCRSLRPWSTHSPPLRRAVSTWQICCARIVHYIIGGHGDNQPTARPGAVRSRSRSKFVLLSAVNSVDLTISQTASLALKEPHVKKYFALILLFLAAPLSLHAQQFTVAPSETAPQPVFTGNLWRDERSARRGTPTQQPNAIQEEVYAEPTEEDEDESEVGNFDLKYGFEFSDRPRNESDGAREMVGPLSFGVKLHPRLTVEIGLDTFISTKAPATPRVTGVGDMSLTADILVVEEGRRNPSLSFLYTATIPTASVEKDLGSGRVDHLILAALSKELGEDGKNGTIGAQFGPNFAGRKGASGFVTSGRLSLTYEYEFENGFGYGGEVAGQTRAEDDPSEAVTTHALTYKFNDRYSMEAGLLVGLTSNAPRVGFFTSFTISGNLRKLFR